MKSRRKFSVVPVPAPVLVIGPHTIPYTMDEKRAAAIAFLGDRHVLSPEYQPRVRVGFFLTAWCSDLARMRSSKA